MRLAALLTTGCVLFATAAQAAWWDNPAAWLRGDPPLIIYQGGGTQKWEPQYAIKIQNGTAILRQYSALVPPKSIQNEDALDMATVKLTEEQVDSLVDQFDAVGYFDRANTMPDSPKPASAEGVYGMIYVERYGDKFRLTADNETIPELNGALFALQKLFPAYPLPVPKAPKAK